MNKVLKIILTILLVVILILLYARYIGTAGLITKEYTIYHESLPSSYDGLKVVHFSDIHYKRAITKNKITKIIKEINVINPDIVIFTGDLIDLDTPLSTEDYQFLTESFNNIEATYGKYAVIGNHDIIDLEKVKNVYKNSNFKLLENTFEVIYNDYNEQIYIGGLGNVTNNQDNIEETLEILETNHIDYQIVITHEPDISNEITKVSDVSLILAGHSHNGQIRLPFIGALYTPPYSEKYYDEYYHINSTDLYISSGIGVSTLNYRLWNHPSINFYRINKKSS